MIKHHLPTDNPSEQASQDPATYSLAQDLLAKFTDQEKSIYLRLLQGMKRKNIALQLAISPKTYDAHRANMLRKTGSSVAQLGAYA
jgi:FixJ family two-component response regulator